MPTASLTVEVKITQGPSYYTVEVVRPITSTSFIEVGSAKQSTTELDAVEALKTIQAAAGDIVTDWVGKAFPIAPVE